VSTINYKTTTKQKEEPTKKDS